jgi:hypothetical protein
MAFGGGIERSVEWAILPVALTVLNATDGQDCPSYIFLRALGALCGEIDLNDR